MGVEYYIINKEDKTFYDLGKGGWYCLKDEIEAVTDQEYLGLFIFEDVFGHDDEEDVDFRAYCDEIAAEIFEMAKCNNIKNLTVIDDCGDDTIILRALKYRCVGSRYRDPKDPKYNKECIESENRHLPDPVSKGYDLDKMMQPAKVYVAGVGYVPVVDSGPHYLQSLVDEYLKVE